MEKAEIVVDVETSPSSQEIIYCAPNCLPHNVPTTYEKRKKATLNIRFPRITRPRWQRQERGKKGGTVANSLSQSMQRKLEKLRGEPNRAENFTIFRVPDNIRENKQNLFEPYVVSIGPLHRDNTSLQTMQEKKWRFLRDFLSRGDHLSLDLCISEMKQLEERARRCYSEMVDLDSDGFVEMMLLDGCFVFEFLSNSSDKLSNKVRWDLNLEVGWKGLYVFVDLLLLENQIPFFIVEKLCDLDLKQEKNNFINHVIDTLPLGLTKEDKPNPNPPAVIHHLVHFYHHYWVPNPETPVVLRSKSFDLSKMLRMLCPSRIKYLLLGSLLCKLCPVSSSRESDAHAAIPCVTKLQEAGIKFKPKSTPSHMFDISFRHGVLEIPRLKIYDNTKPLFSNLVAFEQCMLGQCIQDQPCTPHMTAFGQFLNSLVNTERDAIILVQCGIIENFLSSEEELTQFCNQLCHGAIIMDDHFLKNLFAEVNRYCESY